MDLQALEAHVAGVEVRFEVTNVGTITSQAATLSYGYVKFIT